MNGISTFQNLQILTIVELGLKDLKPFIEKGVYVTAKKTCHTAAFSSSLVQYEPASNHGWYQTK